MANIEDRPNLKICIDNTDEGTESDDEGRLEDDVANVSVQADAGSDSENSSSYSELRGEIPKMMFRGKCGTACHILDCF